MDIHFGLSAKIVNLETAFLYGNPEEGIYVESSLGMLNMGKDDWIT